MVNLIAAYALCQICSSILTIAFIFKLNLFFFVDSPGIQSVHRDGWVGTPPGEQQDVDGLHQLQSQHHASWESKDR